MEKVPLKSAKFCLYDYTSHKTSGIIFNKNKNLQIYRVAANITEYHDISKLIFLRIIIPKFMMIRKSFHVKIV